jgi:hypothetical protein
MVVWNDLLAPRRPAQSQRRMSRRSQAGAPADTPAARDGALLPATPASGAATQRRTCALDLAGLAASLPSPAPLLCLTTDVHGSPLPAPECHMDQDDATNGSCSAAKGEDDVVTETFRKLVAQKAVKELGGAGGRIATKAQMEDIPQMLGECAELFPLEAKTVSGALKKNQKPACLKLFSWQKCSKTALPQSCERRETA